MYKYMDRGLRLQNRRANHSNCELCRWTCVTG